MDSEYRGFRCLALWHEVRQRGLCGSLWRAGYEMRKRLGLVESSFRTDPIAPDELCGLFSPPLGSPADLRRLVRDRLARTFLFSPDAREAYVQAVRRHCPDRLDALRRAADDVCRGRFEFMGQTFDFADGPINWHLAPETGRSWPRVRWNRFDVYDADAPGDVKFTWELNRHQYWPTLGRAWWLFGDDRYAEAWVRQVTGWLEDNPPEIGVNWRSNLEHAIRMVNWWIALAFFLPAPQLSDDVLARIIGTMVLKSRHIVADLDYSRINMANNHLLGDAMGLAVMGLALPELSESGSWRALGLRTLWTEAVRQIHPDGASFECATSYHRFVAYFYVLVLRLCDNHRIPVPEPVRKRLERMFDFVLHLRRPDGRVPSIGDWDDGRTVVLSEQALDDVRPMLSTGAVLFSRSDMAWAAGRIDEETIWLLGPEAGETFASLHPAPPSATSRSFPNGGYFISRTDWTDQAHYAVVRNGPFDSHTHADLLNVELSAFAQPILVDPGTYTYNGPWSWRTYFRGARAHNALLVDGQGQALAHRIFRWLFPPTGRTLHWQTTPFIDYYEGEHDGFRRRPGRPVHRRVLLAVRGEYWLVLDVLLGRGRHDVELRLHFDPSLEVAVLEGRLQAKAPSGGGATIGIACSAAYSVSTARGRTDPIEGWYSAGYGRKVPSTTAILKTSTVLPAWMAWVVLPFRDKPIQATLRQMAAHPRGSDITETPVCLAVEMAEVADEVVYSAADRPRFTTTATGLGVSVGAAWVRRSRSTQQILNRWTRTDVGS